MGTISHLLYKTRCPACAAQGKDKSGDNLGVYSDGHSYCYSCGHGSTASLTGKLGKQQKEQKVIPDLPNDIDIVLSKEAVNWLQQYFPDTKDFPLCYWSEEEAKLIFPIMDSQQRNLLAWQYRYFGFKEGHPKWVGYGINENLIHICSSNGVGSNSSLCLVEDLISGVKVGHITPTLVLFGSNISLKRLATIKTLGYNEVIIWLDWDKRDYVIKAAQLAQSIGLQARVIHTQLDPKEYTIKEIKELL